MMRIPTDERLRESSLRRLHDDRRALARQLRPRRPPRGWRDFRCILHCHSALSHDSRGTIAEIAAAARACRVDAVFLSDHPQKEKDVVAAGPRGVVDGVRFIPGSETNGYLLYPGDGRLPRLDVPEQALADAIQASGGLLFVAHPEGHTDWSVRGVTGMEIYNVHADFAEERGLLRTLSRPDARGSWEGLFRLAEVFRAFPAEAMAALADYPDAYLARYDALSAERSVTAIAANDAHQNVGVTVWGAEGGRYRMEDALGEPIAILEGAAHPYLARLCGPPVPGRELLRHRFDPYPISLGYVSTHLLAAQGDEASLRRALADGRTYVAFDFLADPAGCGFVARAGRQTATLGGTLPFAAGATLSAEAPLSCRWRLLRDGKEMAAGQGRALSVPAPGPGVYRWEAWLNLAGEERPWILAGALRLTG